MLGIKTYEIICMVDTHFLDFILNRIPHVPCLVYVAYLMLHLSIYFFFTKKQTQNKTNQTNKTHKTKQNPPPKKDKKVFPSNLHSLIQF